MPVAGDKDGKLKLAGGPCCPGECNCTWTLTFQFRLDSSEYHASYHENDIIDLAEDYVYPKADGDNLVWVLGTNVDEFELASGNTIESPGNFFDTWHTCSLTMQYNTGDDNWYVALNIDSLSLGAKPMTGAPWNLTGGDDGATGTFQFTGPRLITANPRQFQSINLNMGKYTFTLPGDDFDFLDNATITSNILSIGHGGDAGTNNGAANLHCLFRDVLSSVSTHLDISGDGNFVRYCPPNPDTTCSFGLGCSNSHTFSHINYDDDITDSTTQFKAWIGPFRYGTTAGSKDPCLYRLNFSIGGSITCNTTGSTGCHSDCGGTPDSTSSAFGNLISPGAGTSNPTILSSGTLVSGNRYLIAHYTAGDDFTNIGAARNESSLTFTATGGTPTNWSNGSILVDTAEHTYSIDCGAVVGTVGCGGFCGAESTAPGNPLVIHYTQSSVPGSSSSTSGDDSYDCPSDDNPTCTDWDTISWNANVDGSITVS
jgi:hypothetical protein